MFGFIFQHHGSHMDYRKMWSPTPILGTGQQVIASMVEELEASEATWADLGDLVEIYHWVKRPFSWGNRDLKPWDFCETAFPWKTAETKPCVSLHSCIYIVYTGYKCCWRIATGKIEGLGIQTPWCKLLLGRLDAEVPICVAQIPTFWRWRSLCLNMSS